ncbi:C10 family peptidase [Hymenobacter sp. H14-R3]|uniref:C10 family peptidase n=1 Tax=Hymenobacter sp. H14-R3 TaxID=3046308 RepID=UPI0024BB2130|nr:C10 family peptidase [Hymenobacter sp. H14-R3]MDJ0364300.1 C10 family peptidase [Hymenobacter sp. H14-R3]
MTATQAALAAENIALSSGVVAQRKNNQAKNDTQRVFQGPQRVLNLTPLLASDGKPALYLCNYAKGGFAIIAADRHMQPILALSEYGALPTTNLQGTRAVSEGLASWLETTRQLAVALRQNPSEKNTQLGAPVAWATLVDKPGDLSKTFFTISGPPSPTYRPLPPADPPADPPTVQVGPLMHTTWGQGCGYNDNVTASGDWYYCYHCPTGCVATAQAQVMYYWHYPASFNWAAMPLNHGTPATAHLMDDLGGKLQMDYAPTGSGTDAGYIDDALKDRYGYKSAEYKNNQDPGLFQTVVDNLNAGQPVILGGFPSVNWFGYPNASGHCWVCDGYIQSYSDGYGYLYFAMNWGWDGASNGWFGYNNWQVTDVNGDTHNYNYAKQYIINIHP